MAPNNEAVEQELKGVDEKAFRTTVDGRLKSLPTHIREFTHKWNATNPYQSPKEHKNLQRQWLALPWSDVEILFSTLMPGIKNLFQPILDIPICPVEHQFPFRYSIQSRIAHADFRNRILQLVEGLSQKSDDPRWLATYVGHLTTPETWHLRSCSLVLAASMNAGGPLADEVFSTLTESARALHPIGIPSDEGLYALMRTNYPGTREFLPKFLLAAQREEGLRSAILNHLVDAPAELRALLLQTILEHDLIRFSSTVLAINQALGLAWDSQSQRVIRDAVELWHKLETAPDSLTQALTQPASPQELWIALRVAAMNRADDVPGLASQAEALTKHTNPDIRALGAKFLAEQDWLMNLPCVAEVVADSEVRTAIQALGSVPRYRAEESDLNEVLDSLHSPIRCPNWIREPLGLSPDSPHPGNRSIYDLALNRLIHNAKELFERCPAKPQKYTGYIWPWNQVEVSKNEAASGLFYLIPDSRLIEKAPYISKIDPWLRSRAAEQLGKFQGQLTPELQQLLLDLLTDSSEDVRKSALKSARVHPIRSEDAPRLEAALNRKPSDLRRGLITLLLSLNDAGALQSCERLLGDKDLQRRLGGLEIARRLQEASRCAEQVTDFVRRYTENRSSLDELEKIQIQAILGEVTEPLPSGESQSPEEGAPKKSRAKGGPAPTGTSASPTVPYVAPTRENGLLLYNPEDRTVSPPPTQPQIQVLSKAAENIIRSLDDLILKHKDTPVVVRNSTDSVPLLEMGYLSSPKIGPGQTPDPADFPLSEVWLEWWNNRPANCRDQDGLEWARAKFYISLVQMRENYRDNTVRLPEQFVALDRLVLGGAYPPSQIKANSQWNRGGLHSSILHWIFCHQDEPFWKKVDLWTCDLLQLCAWALLQNANTLFDRFRVNYGSSDLRNYDALQEALTYFSPDSKLSHLWNAGVEYEGSQKSFRCQDPALAARIWQLMDWLCKPVMPAPKGHPRAGQLVRIFELRPRKSANTKTDDDQPSVLLRIMGAVGNLLGTGHSDHQDDDLAKHLQDTGSESEGSKANWEYPIPPPPYFVPHVAFLAAARNQGIANRADLFAKVLRKDTTRGHYYSDGNLPLSFLTSRRRNPLLDYCPELDEVVQLVRDRLVDHELRRGEEPTAFSDMVLSIVTLPGAQRLVRVMAALGSTDLKRNSLWGSVEANRSTVFSHLIRISVPGPDDTPELFTRLVREAKIPARRIVEVAMFSPHWAQWCEIALEQPGFEDAIWWIHAHVKDDSWSPAGTIKEEWKAIISERTSVPADELAAGAVDAQWFAETTARLGPDQWDTILKVAKYATDGGTGHTRATLFASAMLGKVTAAESTVRINTKRHQDSVRALGLAVLPPDDDTHRNEREAEILARYETLNEFLRTSRQFGSQRRESEKRAYSIAMDNLARNAGYTDPLRLQWALETKAIADLAAGPVSVTEGDATITLSVDSFGDPELTYSSKGKEVKSLPASLKKHPEAKALTERRTQLKRQASRMKLSLESSMVQGDEFFGHELAALAHHPLMAPRLASLVFLNETSSVLGTPANSGQHLEDIEGEMRPIAPGDRLRIAHPLDLLQTGQWSQWQARTFRREIIQPFKQVFRELYVLTDTERQDAGKLSRRYSGHQVNPRQAQALLGSKGWVMAHEEGCRRTFHSERITARLDQVFAWDTAALVEGITIEEVYFTKSGNWEALRLDEVPGRVFSETMRDLDLVVSVAHRGNADPEASASTVEMRAALVRETADLLKLSNVRVEERRALIDGELGHYSVHLASGVSHRMPGGSLFIVPVHAGHRGRIFLPFADDDPKTAEILSTVLLLARDKDIKDPNLRSQLKG